MGSKAEESKQVRRARAKLQQQLNKEHSLITPEAIARVSKGIKRWLSRGKSERLKIENTVVLFDSNQHAAPATQAINELRSQLTRELGTADKPSSLHGRVTKTD